MRRLQRPAHPSTRTDPTKVAEVPLEQAEAHRFRGRGSRAWRAPGMAWGLANVRKAWSEGLRNHRVAYARAEPSCTDLVHPLASYGRLMSKTGERAGRPRQHPPTVGARTGRTPNGVQRPPLSSPDAEPKTAHGSFTETHPASLTGPRERSCDNFSGHRGRFLSHDFPKVVASQDENSRIQRKPRSQRRLTAVPTCCSAEACQVADSEELFCELGASG
jgi:hypothetical protein